ASENIDFTGLSHVFLLGGKSYSLFFYMINQKQRSKERGLGQQYIFLSRKKARENHLEEHHGGSGLPQMGR
ncbi:MAG: hypothetical protein ACLU41_10365, partial [Anaerotignum lactatifermentans]